MASTSATGSKRKIEDMGAFDGVAPSASSSASKAIKKPSYDVFINHRGPDVKSTLASVLYGILTGMSLSVFLDSEELEYGDFLPRAIEAAMTSAFLHIAIFSKGYAESPWCLAELSFMLKSGATIVPIFYHVEPTDLRYVAHGKGMYVEAFKKHEEKGRYSPEKLQEWKDALSNISFYNGQIIKTNDDEVRLLKNIVNCVWKAINNVPLVVAKHAVGLKEIVQDFEMNTHGSAEPDQDVQIVGIWGMGGSGKTTLAKEIYNKNSTSMDRSSFIFDVREDAPKLANKQTQLLNDLGVKNVTINSTEQGKAFLTRHLKSFRVLIVLDDVDCTDQLDALLPVKDRLGGGSLIIVTTREYEVLRSWGISSVYKMKALDPSFGEQLFCWHAFLQSSPLDGFEKLVKKFVEACNGLPLALKVFGGQLHGEFRKEYWESLLHKISRILPNEIKDKLKVSYDALDCEEKEMFLDTACFFVGEDNSLAIEIWNGSGWSGLHGWERLLNKCLVELDGDNRIRMHDHLKDLGREIASQHSPYRLWLRQQIIDPDKQTEKRNAMRGIMAVRMGEWERPARSLWGGAFLKLLYRPRIPETLSPCVVSPRGQLMVNTYGGILSLAPSLLGLKILVIRGDYFNQVFGEISRELVWLRWLEIGQRNLPSQLSLKNLRVLELYELPRMGKYHLEELWEADEDAPEQLRELVISDCHKFQRFPNSIGCLKELKKIVIQGFNNILSLPEEFCSLQSLEHFQLEYCSLESLPSSFGNLRKLRYLNLSSWSNLRMLPISFKNLILLQYLDLSGCEQLKLSSEDFQNIRKLEFLNLASCDQVEELPRHITDQASLREFGSGPMKMLRELPINIGQLNRLRKMEIASDLLTGLPPSFGDLFSLTNLSIKDCPNLECLPPFLGNLLSLTNLLIQDCPKLECLPSSLADLPSLTYLSICYCPNLKCLPSVGRLNLLKIEECPISQVDLGAASLPFTFSNLKKINLICTEVRRISISEDLCPHLQELQLQSNHHLMEIEALPVNLKWLQIVYCPELDVLPTFARSTSLRELVLVDCNRIEKIEGLQYCTRLETLMVNSHWEVPGIESLEHMVKLRTLELRANKGSAIERCIQTIQKWPDEVVICTRAVPDAASLVNSLLSPSLVVVDSISNQKLYSKPKLVLKSFSNGDAIMLCFVINCFSSKILFSIDCGRLDKYEIRMFEGKWIWIGVFTQRSNNEWLTAEQITLTGYYEEEDTTREGCDEDEEVDEQQSDEEQCDEVDDGECKEEEEIDEEDEEIDEEEDKMEEEAEEVEIGLVVRGEEQRLVEALHRLLPLLEHQL